MPPLTVHMISNVSQRCGLLNSFDQQHPGEPWISYTITKAGVFVHTTVRSTVPCTQSDRRYHNYA